MLTFHCHVFILWGSTLVFFWFVPQSEKKYFGLCKLKLKHAKHIDMHIVKLYIYCYLAILNVVHEAEENSFHLFLLCRIYCSKKSVNTSSINIFFPLTMSLPTSAVLEYSAQWIVIFIFNPVKHLILSLAYSSYIVMLYSLNIYN